MDISVTIHLSEVKGPVIDRLKRAHFLDDLFGSVFSSEYQAITELAATPAFIDAMEEIMALSISA